jgi:hypothetical protein
LECPISTQSCHKRSDYFRPSVNLRDEAGAGISARSLRISGAPRSAGLVKPKLLTTIQDYSAKLFVADALAGVTVAMVALPLSIAIAIASGAEPAAGLFTAIVGGFLISTLGGSRVQIAGRPAFIVVVYR